MVLNILHPDTLRTPVQITKEQVAKSFPANGRVPGWVPVVGGASAPWGMRAAFNQLAEWLGLEWRAKRIRNASPEDIHMNLKQGNQVTMLRFWKGGGAHWSNVVKFAPEQNSVYMLDPNPYLERLSAGKKVQRISWKECYRDWDRQPWWAKILGLKRELIVYHRIAN